jgi:hypothetical protein
MSSSILFPAAVLVFWSMLVMVWMTVTRIPALKKVMADRAAASGGGSGTAAAGGRYQDIEKLIPAKVNWKSHNYTHLMEQPTIFYPAVIIIHLTDTGHGINLYLAWAYVILRILHSLWQGLINTLPVRMALFAISSLCLLALSLHAVLAFI